MSDSKNQIVSSLFVLHLICREVGTCSCHGVDLAELIQVLPGVSFLASGFSSLTLSLLCGVLENEALGLCEAEGYLSLQPSLSLNSLQPECLVLCLNKDQYINTRNNQHNVLVEQLWSRPDPLPHRISLCRRVGQKRGTEWKLAEG